MDGLADRPMGIVKHERWLAWGFGHGVMVRPQWLADAIVTVWNWVSCRAFGCQWYPEIIWDDAEDEPRASETQEFCPNCCATRSVSA